MKISSAELLSSESGKTYTEGYRLVYFNNESYSICNYCKTIEGFMIGLAECDPIIDEDDIPPFISIDDMLDRCLKLSKGSTAVALYKTDGTCVARKNKIILKK